MSRTRYKVVKNFVQALQDEKIIKPFSYRAKNGMTTTLFASSDPRTLSPYILALALQPNGYFCNISAVYYHQLSHQVPTTVYICHENIDAKARNRKRILSDSDIRQSFLGAHRHTNYVYSINRFSIAVVDRIKGTRFGVEKVAANDVQPPGNSLITGLERTLIDAVVSPHYNGGIANVTTYFANAGSRLDAKRLIEIYRQLDFAYPYHQTIGFLLDRTGLRDAADLIHRTLPVKNTFFVDHSAKSSWLHDKKWNIYYPKGLIDEH